MGAKVGVPYREPEHSYQYQKSERVFEIKKNYSPRKETQEN